MATRAVFTAAEVLEELDNSDSGGEMSDGSEDDFDGYVDDDDMEARWMEECNNEEESVGGEGENASGEEMDNSEDRSTNEEDQDSSMDEDVPSIPPPTLSALDALCPCQAVPLHSTTSPPS